MKNKLYNNGYVIKSCDPYMYPYEVYYQTVDDGIYQGVGRNLTWPLEYQLDPMSQSLSEEAWNRWGWYNIRLQTVPDLEYLQRYQEHCKRLNLETYCLKIESEMPDITSNLNLPEEVCLGYEVTTPGIQIACLREDMIDMDLKEMLSPIVKKLNPYGLASSLEIMKDYLMRREEICDKWGDNIEKYEFMQIVKVSRVILSDLI